MASIAPLPIMNNSNLDIGRPGQQLLPGYVVKLLKTLKIPFGTDRTMNGVDVDPTIAVISHVIDCLGALRDINKVYRAKGSLASRSVGTRAMFGFTAELGNILLDSITFEPPADLSDSSIYYGQVASSILTVFPEIAAQVTPATGKVLIHHTALKTSPTMAMESIKLVVKAFPAGAWTADRTGALPLHWVTHNPHCSQEMINFLINANPKGPWVADVDGYLPLHWAVNQDYPNIDVIAALIAANASASAKACNKGSLPLHWCVNRARPHLGVMRALLQVHPDGVRTFDKTGWLPTHQCVNRSDVSIDALQLLTELYPQGLQCPNVNGQLPLHRALDQNPPNLEAIQLMLEAFPGAAKVADDEGYLPLHLALDCARPNPTIARMLLDHYPESAFHKSKDGLLPIHCIISSLNPVIDIIELLLQIFPDSTESMAVDVIPVDEMADPETWEGEWVEKRWTPLSRAIDRGLDSIVMLFRDALNAGKHAALQSQGQGQQGGRGMAANSATTKNMMPQSQPPLNSDGQFMPSPANGGPSTSSNEGANRSRQQQQGLVLGGVLDSPYDDDGLDEPGTAGNNGHHMHQQMMNNANHRNAHQGQGQGQGQPLHHAQSMPPQQQVPLRERAPGGMTRGPSLYGPAGNVNPHGQSANSLNIADLKIRDHNRDRDRDRNRDGRDHDRDREGRDRDRDRDHKRSSRGQHRSSSRDVRGERSSSRQRGSGGRDYYEGEGGEEDRGEHRGGDRDRDRGDKHRGGSSRNHRSSSRNHGRDRSSSRDPNRDRERSERNGGGGSSRYPPQERIYENAEYGDIESPPRYGDDANEAVTPYEGEPGYSSNNARSGSTKLRVMSGSAPSAPSNAPPRGMLEAATGRPATQRGPDGRTPTSAHHNNNQVQGQGQGQSQNQGGSGSGSRRYGMASDDEDLSPVGGPQYVHHQHSGDELV